MNSEAAERAAATKPGPIVAWLMDTGDGASWLELGATKPAPDARATARPLVFAEQTVPKAETALRKAVEFAEYMATAAAQLMEAAVTLDNVRFLINNRRRDMPDALNNAESAFDECCKGLRSAIYEFRMRADKAVATAPATGAGVAA